MTNESAGSLNGARLYVIGDIHGRLDLLHRIVEQIHLDVDRRPPSDCLIVTLGDYVDRGPDSFGVVERLARNPFGVKYTALRGNHETLMETFLADPAIGDHWARLGGLETLHSYGVPVDALMAGRGFDQAARRLKAAIPDEHFEFLSTLKLSATVGGNFLCHAGIRPGVPLDQQSSEDLQWIRDEFLNSTMDFGKLVIHGHTPIEWPEVLPNRINIDTGAFATGRLTCLVIDGNAHRFFFTA
jgi:serine/threonine protein phosphatase 1